MVSEVGSCEDLGCGLFDGVGGQRHVLKIEGDRLQIIAITYNIYYPSYHSPLSELLWPAYYLSYHCLCFI